ncbi:hypothetical protein OG365_20585 [Streptomyces sp. NBC_00853]|uniref:hypothetical protein n=1 Tax=Streptomyces sp. NBC_00853 TaxID=2903681 RepID=UPI003872E7E2|nr:hypothetical protein OG365_20585 [Streptomyces sp. NBC_00853]
MKKALLAATAAASALAASLVAAPLAAASGWDRHDRSAVPFTEATVTAGAEG